MLLLVVVGAGLRLWNLEGLGDFDFDEVAAVWYARAGLLDIVADIARAPFEHPPLYYMALHVWIGWFGESEPIARAFSIPFGLLLIPATYRLARCYVAAWPAVIAAILVTASPLLIFFSREARMYAPGRSIRRAGAVAVRACDAVRAPARLGGRGCLRRGG